MSTVAVTAPARPVTRRGSAGRCAPRSCWPAPGWGVSAERQQAVAEVLGGLVPPAGRLAPGQLRAVTAGLAARGGLWADLVVRDPDVRWYLPLHRSNSCDVWLLAWERGQDTDWHDHGGSSGSFVVAEGCLAEQYRGPGGRRIAHRRLLAGEAVAFGPAHVHNVAHAGGGPATSIHAYSPPLAAMTYYTATDYGLIARETVAVDGPEGARGRGGPGAALAQASASAARLTPDSLPADAPSIDQLLADARGGLARLRPEAAFAALTNGAALVDIRPAEQRAAEGEVPGAIIIGRNVLEWRLDPRSEARIPALARADAQIIVMCSEGYASTLAAATLRRIGLHAATDLDGGFQAWKAAGLPTRTAQPTRLCVPNTRATAEPDTVTDDRCQDTQDAVAAIGTWTSTGCEMPEPEPGNRLEVRASPLSESAETTASRPRRAAMRCVLSMTVLPAVRAEPAGLGGPQATANARSGR